MKTKWKMGLALLAPVFAMALAACGQEEPTPTPTPPTAATGDPTPTPDAFQVEWDALIEAAQKEGRLVTMFGGSVAPEAEPIYNFFGEKFGIKIIFGRGGARNQANRLLAEHAAGRSTVDTIHAGDTSSHELLIPSGILQPVLPLLFHPEVTDPSLWYRGRHWFSDTEQQYRFVYAASAAPGTGGGVAYNTNLVTLEEALSWTSMADLLDDKWRGQIVSEHPLFEPGGSSLQRYLNPGIGPEWMERFFGDPSLDIFWTQEQRVGADGLALGRWSLAVWLGGGDDLDALVAGGAPVQRRDTIFQAEHGVLALSPQSGDLSAEHGGAIMLPDNPPHPNAQKLFVNWVATREGQTVMHDVAGRRGWTEDQLHTLVSLREDGIPLGPRVDPAAVRDPSVDYVGLNLRPESHALNFEIQDWIRAVFTAGYVDGTALPPRPFEPEEYQDLRPSFDSDLYPHLRDAKGY